METSSSSRKDIDFKQSRISRLLCLFVLQKETQIYISFYVFKCLYYAIIAEWSAIPTQISERKQMICTLKLSDEVMEQETFCFLIKGWKMCPEKRLEFCLAWTKEGFEATLLLSATF